MQVGGFRGGEVDGHGTDSRERDAILEGARDVRVMHGDPRAGKKLSTSPPSEYAHVGTTWRDERRVDGRSRPPRGPASFHRRRARRLVLLVVGQVDAAGVEVVLEDLAVAAPLDEIGRASCRERV